jgi:hypothetical protein
VRGDSSSVVRVGRHVGIFDELSQRRRWPLKKAKKKFSVPVG